MQGGAPLKIHVNKTALAPGETVTITLTAQGKDIVFHPPKK